MNKFIGQQAYQNNSVANPQIEDAHGAVSVCLETLLHNLKVLADRPPMALSFSTEYPPNA